MPLFACVTLDSCMLFRVEEDSTTNPNKTVITVVGSLPEKKPQADIASLVVIYGEDLGRRIPLATPRIVIGRSSGSGVQIEQESVSRSHCQIVLRNGRHTVQDLGSTNGTYVNDELVESLELRDGDQVKVGRTILKFIKGGNAEAAYHEEIYRLMTVDGLTQVHNKRYFDEMMDKEFSRAVRYGGPFSLIVFDIDHFKSINDTQGHLAGDAVLRQLGRLVHEHVRRDDVVARIGGEEFAVITPEIHINGAVELAEKLRRLVEHTSFTFESDVLRFTISAGVTEWGAAFKNFEEMVQAADEKLYQSKNNGRNRVCF